MNRWIYTASGVAVAVLTLTNCKTESRKQAPVAPAQNCPPGTVYSPNGANQNPIPQATGTAWNQSPSTNPIPGQQGSTWSTNQSPSGYTGYQLSQDLALQQTAVTWQQIQPIISRSCTNGACHSAQARAGGFDLSSYQLTRNSGAAVVASVQLNARRRMPPNAPLPQNEIQLFNLWQQGNFLETSAGVGGVTGSTGSTGGSTGYNTGYNTGYGYSSSPVPNYGSVNNTYNNNSTIPANCVPVSGGTYR